MAHIEQIVFCTYTKNLHPKKFENVSVLDIGSLDINGNNRYLFSGSYSYIGVDLGPGKNVDVICRGHEFKSETLFDVVISTECFEHDEYYHLSLKNMYDHLKSGGIFLFTCATTGRPEHGTRRKSPYAAPYVGDYYKNLTENDIRQVLDIDKLFTEYEFQDRKTFPQDLYFYGIKK